MIFHGYPYSAPRFLCAPATRCLRCHSTKLDTQDVLQNADEEWSEENPPREVTFWYCRSCSGSDTVNIGVGVQNEVTRRVSWSYKYLYAAEEGTEGMLLTGGDSLDEIDFDDEGQTEIISLRGHLPSVGSALSSMFQEPSDWPLQVSTRASAFALALRHLADELETEQEVLGPGNQQSIYRQVVYSAMSNASSSTSEIVLADRSNLREILLTSNSFNDIQPSFSPDGSKIVFVSGDYDGDIYVMNANGSNVVRLISNRARNSHPYWR